MTENANEQETLYLPDIRCPDVQAFIAALLSQSKKSAFGRQPRIQNTAHNPEYVRTVNDDYPALQCWFNCIDYCLKKGGTPVYGWLIARLENPLGYVAQHHAVVNTGTELLDLTYGGQFDKILFVPDSTTPLSLETNPMYIPANFYAEEGKTHWQGIDDESDNFYLLKMAPQTAHLALITQAKTKNII